MSAQWRSSFLPGAKEHAFHASGDASPRFLWAGLWLTDGGECTVATECVAQARGVGDPRHGLDRGNVLVASRALACGWPVAGRGNEDPRPDRGMLEEVAQPQHALTKGGRR